MDLNKDNRDIYTIDSESYSEYMQDNWKKPKDLLTSFIKILFIILLVVMGYFFYKIVKADLSFSEVFNKKKLLATYKFFNANDKPLYIKEEDYVEALAVISPIEIQENKKTVVLAVSKNYDEPVVEVKIKEESSRQEEKVLEAIVEKVEEPKVKKEISDDDLLSTEYLKRVSEGMNSF